MEVIHNLLFLLRENAIDMDLDKAENCLRSLEKSTYKTVVVFNQGFWTNESLENYLKQFNLNSIVIGDNTNKGIVIGRQSSFEYIWDNFPNCGFISELHMDMVFTHGWEKPLVDYLNCHDEPMISCGIVDKSGELLFLNSKTQDLPKTSAQMDDFLLKLRKNVVIFGFTHPCIHNAGILKTVGGYNTSFLAGKQAFEDDSLLLGYYYYYGTRSNWKPKVNYQSVVYHEIAGQRYGLNNSIMINLHGLIRQYGGMGMKHLAAIHQSPWHIRFFTEQFKASIKS